MEAANTPTRLSAITGIPTHTIHTWVDKYPSILERTPAIAELAVTLLAHGHSPDILRILDYNPHPDPNSWIVSGSGNPHIDRTLDTAIFPNLPSALAYMQTRPHPGAYHLSHIGAITNRTETIAS